MKTWLEVKISQQLILDLQVISIAGLRLNGKLNNETVELLVMLFLFNSLTTIVPII